MIIIDTSAWVSFFRGEKKGSPVKEIIMDDIALLHPLVYGELLLGGLSNRATELMTAVKKVKLAEYDTVIRFIQETGLAGKGIGWVDVNIVISAIITKSSVLTCDTSLKDLCVDLNCSL